MRFIQITRVCLVVIGLLALEPTAWADAATQDAQVKPDVPASPPDTAKKVPTADTPRESFSPSPWIPISGTLLFLLIGAAFVARGLRRNDDDTERRWSLADAVSEESTITKDGKLQTVLAASMSRLIALYGMLMILAFFLGIGIVNLWDLAMNTKLPEGNAAATKFLLGGMSLFAPYLANQARAAFDAIGNMSPRDGRPS